MVPRLPEDVPPMLCKIGEPFDSDDFVFEVKWDGVRTLAYVEDGDYRLHSRHRRDLKQRYPELVGLLRLPAGTLLDGELIVLRPDGTPDFRAMLGREGARSQTSVVRGARSSPVSYVVFDLLYEAFEPLLDWPLRERRLRLHALVAALGDGRVMLSEGVVGSGRQLFAAAKARALEGIVGKKLDSRYRPGERSDAWLKIKPVQTLQCAILGYEPDGERDFKSLIVAAETDGRLQCVGRVGGGFTVAQKQRVWKLLQARRTDRPLIDPGMSGCWVEPGLYCSVNYLERTASGSLRAPVFAGMIEA